MFVNAVLAARITFQWRLCIVLRSGALFFFFKRQEAATAEVPEHDNNAAEGWRSARGLFM